MKVFIKYILKSMLEKKARFFLLIFAIAMSSGLFIGSMGAIDVATGSFSKTILQGFEEKEVLITTMDGDVFYNTNSIIEKGVKDLLPVLLGNAVMDNEDLTNITIHGRETKYINKDNIIEGNFWDSFKGKEAIISKRISEELNLHMGDSINIIFNGKKETLKVVGVNSNHGLFYSDQKGDFTIIAPYDFMEEMYGVNNKYNLLLANKTEDTLKESIEIFNNANKDFKASELFDEEAIENQIGQLTTYFYLMLTIVVLMSGVIIYGSFKLTITERLPVIGTFFSQGATRGNVKAILYLENILYGGIGGILGVATGMGLLYLVNYSVSPLKEYGIIESFAFNIWYGVFGLIFALILSIISCTIPILGSDGLQVKDIILNHVNTTTELGWWRFILGSIILIAVVILNLLKVTLLIELSPILLIISLIALLLVYPKIIDLFTNFLFSRLKGTLKITGLALNNIKTSKALLGNITLIIISILAIVIINSVGFSVKEAVTGAYTDINFDISITNFKGGDHTLREMLIAKLKEEPDIDGMSIHEVYVANGKVEDNNAIIIGVEPKKYREYNQYLSLKDEVYEEVYNRFENSSIKNVILSESMAKKLNVGEGDLLNMEINGLNKEFTVAGLIDGKLYYSGGFILMDSKDLKDDFKFLTSNEIFLNTTKNPEEVKKDIEKVVKEFGGSISTFEESKKINLEGNQQFINVLSIFSLMAIVIGALGAINNMLISFIQRKKELAVLSSIGMTSRQRGAMLTLESLFCVVWSMVITIPYCYLVTSILSKLTKLIGLPLDINFNIKTMPLFFMAATIMILLATIPVLLNNRKLSIIHEIKYE